MGKFADALRENRQGKFCLPYQEGWCAEHWRSYACRSSAAETLDDQDARILEIGYEIGSRCQQVWADIRLQEQTAPLPAICAALIAQINVLYAGSEMGGRQDAATAAPRLTEKVEKNAVNAEQLVDIISDYIFSRLKAGKLSTTLDISPILGDHATHSYAVGLRDLLRSVAAFRFAFDQLLFLDAPVAVEDGRIGCRIAKGGFSEIYLVQSKISQIAESLIAGSINRKRPTSGPREYVDYDLVRRVDFTNGEFFINYGYLPFDVLKSALALMRGSVEAEYLFQTLETVDEGRNIHRAWDILHSLSKAMLENADRQGNSTLLASGINRAHLIGIIARCLRSSATRARKIVEFFTFSSGFSGSRDGIWSRPLMRIDKNLVSISHIAILEINHFRLLHHLISNANLSTLRGRKFESKCIEQLGSAPLRGVVEVVSLSNPVYGLLGIQSLETDFLLRMGNIVLVCEAKSTSHVATPREFWHGYSTMKKGGDQLKKRIQKLLSHREDVEKWLSGTTKESLDFVPVIVTNTHMFEGLCVDGVHVVSLLAMIRYFCRKENLPCLEEAYYRREGLDIFLSSPIGGDEIKKLLEVQRGFIYCGLHGQLITFEYLALPGEGVSVT